MAPVAFRTFTGKTESGFKWRTPKLRMRKVRRIAPPGLELEIPEDLTPENYLRSIGGDCEDFADKFEKIDELFETSGSEMKGKEIPCKQRKYILRKYSF